MTITVITATAIDVYETELYCILSLVNKSSYTTGLAVSFNENVTALMTLVTLSLPPN
jgi:hypothetical protein